MDATSLVNSLRVRPGFSSFSKEYTGHAGSMVVVRFLKMVTKMLHFLTG